MWEIPKGLFIDTGKFYLLFTVQTVRKYGCFFLFVWGFSKGRAYAYSIHHDQETSKSLPYVLYSGS